MNERIQNFDGTLLVVTDPYCGDELRLEIDAEHKDLLTVMIWDDQQESFGNFDLTPNQAGNVARHLQAWANKRAGGQEHQP